jgi:DNA-binding transcriptional regulator YiaG
LKPPTPVEIAALHATHGLTQAQIAALLHTSARTWRKWELGERTMNLALWDCVRLKLSGKQHDGFSSD